MNEPILPAHRQIAEQLLGLIRTGSFGPGDRLPPESVLAQQFGASRGTIRRAFQVLASQSLVETRRGSHGGTFVIMPDIPFASVQLENKLAILASGKEFSLKDLVAVCAILEIPAAAIAAARRTEEDVLLLGRSAQRTADDTSSGALGECAAFHSQVIMATHNALLPILAKPSIRVLLRGLETSEGYGGNLRTTVFDEHQLVLRCVSSHDAAGAAAAMRAHFGTLSALANIGRDDCVRGDEHD